MLTALTAPDLTFLFLAIVVALGSALVTLLWQIQHHPRPQPKRRSH